MQRTALFDAVNNPNYAADANERSSQNARIRVPAHASWKILDFSLIFLAGPGKSLDFLVGESVRTLCKGSSLRWIEMDALMVSAAVLFVLHVLISTNLSKSLVLQ